MQDLDDVRRLWKAQAALTAPPAHELRQAFERQVRKNRRIYLLKVCAALGALASMTAVMSTSLASIAGLAAMACGFGVFLVLEMKARGTLDRMEYGAPSAGFAREAADKIRSFETPGRAQRYSLLVGTLAGSNLVLAGSLSGDLKHRMVLHVSISVVALVSYEIGLKFRVFAIRKQYGQLAERLTDFLRGSE